MRVSAWVLVPCLIALRTEFNEVAPHRDKGADGSIGDSAHTSSSDHTPDEDSDVLRDHDADRKNEVHACDIDSSGTWPDGKGNQAGAWFDKRVKAIIARERARWLDPHDVCRLEYVIWRGQIYSRIRDFKPVKYTLADQHTNHAHFSARYITAAENDTSPWGVSEDTVTPDDRTAIAKEVAALLKPQLDAAASAWDDTFNKAPNIETAGERLAQIKNDVEAIRADVDTILSTLHTTAP